MDSPQTYRGREGGGGRKGGEEEREGGGGGRKVGEGGNGGRKSEGRKERRREGCFSLVFDIETVFALFLILHIWFSTSFSYIFLFIIFFFKKS